jgi:DNA topoisomerase-1
VLRDGAAGLFLAASKFPKIRETRAPKVAELRSVADQLDPKYQFLLEAPDVDPEGNPTVVKFSRKNQAQYVGSETAEGKQTKWSLVFQDGKWVEA